MFLSIYLNQSSSHFQSMSPCLWNLTCCPRHCLSLSLSGDVDVIGDVYVIGDVVFISEVDVIAIGDDTFILVMSLKISRHDRPWNWCWFYCHC